MARPPHAGLVLLALVLLLPAGLGHVPHTRASLQPYEAPRDVESSLNGTVATFDLYDRADRMRNFVRHVVAPGRMAFTVEMRDDAPSAEGALQARWDLSRLLLYRDVNQDGAFQPNADAVLKSWRFVNYQWRTEGVRQVSVGSARGVDDVLWTGTLGGAPNVTVEVVAAGVDVADEGARARPQDLLVYFTVPQLPPRTTGTLYAIEGTVVTPAGSVVVPDVTENLTVGLHVDQGRKRAYFDWGGEALLDGREGRMHLALDDPATTPQGQETRAFRWSFPVLDESLRIVFVSAVEAAPVTRQGVPDAGLVGGALALLAAALLLRRR